jgi:hypothetical protein
MRFPENSVVLVVLTFEVFAQAGLDDLAEAIDVERQPLGQLGVFRERDDDAHLRRRYLDRHQQLGGRREELHHLVDADDGRRRDRSCAEQEAASLEVHGHFTL